MLYDLRINNIYWKEIEGVDIESALNNAGMDPAAGMRLTEDMTMDTRHKRQKKKWLKNNTGLKKLGHFEFYFDFPVVGESKKFGSRPNKSTLISTFEREIKGYPHDTEWIVFFRDYVSNNEIEGISE